MNIKNIIKTRVMLLDQLLCLLLEPCDLSGVLTKLL